MEMAVEKEKKVSLRNVFVNILALLKWTKSYLFEVLAGYGYKPFRVIFWSLILIIFGTFAFSSHYMNGHIVNSSITNPSSFNGFAFALDTFVPLINLREAENWELINNGSQAFQPMLMFYWSYIFNGWIFTAIFAASITGIIKK